MSAPANAKSSGEIAKHRSLPCGTYTVWCAPLRPQSPSAVHSVPFGKTNVVTLVAGVVEMRREPATYRVVLSPWKCWTLATRASSRCALVIRVTSETPRYRPHVSKITPKRPIPAALFSTRSRYHAASTCYASAVVRARIALSLTFVVLALAAITPSLSSAQRTYTVRPGDTLARIARRYHTTITSIREANGLHDDAVRDGQEIFVPRAGEETEPHAPAATDRAQRAAHARADRLGLGRARAGRSLLVHAPERRWVVAAGAARGIVGTLLMPVAGGAMIRGWGSGPGGYHLAMDIRGRTGQPIRACERGIVAYAGNEISGYGNFVMIIHPNGLVTAYAHNREMLVTAGQMVARGDRVSTLGNSGLSHGPHLHFMLIHDGEHCDPAPLFRPHIGPRTPEARWRRGHEPEGVQCLPRSARPHPDYVHGHRRDAAEDDTGEDDDDDVEVDPAD